MGGATAAEDRVARALTELVAAYGADRLADPATLRSALNDHLGADATALRREVKLLVEAAAEASRRSCGLRAGQAPSATASPRRAGC